MALDNAERRILTLLQANGRMPNVELAAEVGMSESACQRRLRKMERAGVVQGYAAIVDKRALGLAVTAFVLVTLEKQPDAQAEGFHRCVQSEPHIVECHATSGSHDYLMKVVARDIDHFSDLVMRNILHYPGVQNVESSFSLQEIKHAYTLPVPD